MKRKRADFSRFYFMSCVDLLDALSKGNDPMSINKHISMEKLVMEENKDSENNRRPSAKEMVTRAGIEKIPFDTPFKLMGKVEVYLVDILNHMKSTIKAIVKKSIQEIESKQQREWIESTPSQACLLTNWFNEICNIYRNNNKKFFKKWRILKAYEIQSKSLSYLINLILEDLTGETMPKIMVIIKSETHSRDVIDKLIQEKVNRTEDFIWQS